MALDHASLYWNMGKEGPEGLLGYRPVYTDLFQFLIRFITHYCAPAFVFLAGTSIALYETNRLNKGTTQREITKYLMIRGLVLLLMEWTLISFIFHADTFYFGVIAAIGAGLLIFSVIRLLSSRIILLLSLGIIFSPIIENIFLNMTFLSFSFILNPVVEILITFFPTEIASYVTIILKHPQWPIALYPLDPWLGVMGLGFVFGRWLIQQQHKVNGTKIIVGRLILAGVSSIVLFFILRLTINHPVNYLGILANEGGFRVDAFAIEVFFLLAKYPPSLAFLLWTLGGMCLLLAVAFYMQNNVRFQKLMFPIMLFGTTSLFFYIIHLYFYGAVPIALGIEKTFSIEITILIWAIGILLLYPVCLLFRKLKNKYPNSIIKYI